MEASTEETANGATWIRDYLLNAAAMARAVQRLEMDCQVGIRHFSAVGISVPLDRAKTIESEILRLESERD
jgi:hypothetical protein